MKKIFRALLKKERTWVYWNEFGYLTTKAGKVRVLQLRDGAKATNYYTISGMQSLIEKDTIGQLVMYTKGKKDSIFTGDVVDCLVMRLGGQHSNWQRETNVNHGKCRVIPMEVYWEEPFDDDGKVLYFGGMRLRPTSKALELIKEYEKPIGSERTLQDINYYNVRQDDLLKVVGNKWENPDII